MELNLENLTLKKEKKYFILVLIVSIIVWAFLIITIFGLPWALIFAAFMWLTNGLFIAYLKSESVLINEQQLPALYNTYKEICQQLNISNKLPELYILQAGGALNAFATRHARRNFIVLFSDIVESYGQTSDEIKFLIGHEIGHIKCRHILKRLFLWPGLLLPLLGSAYHRACEASCDRYGAFAAKNTDGAIKALMILSGGKHIGKEMSVDAFGEQHKNFRGFFISWHELTSGYPTLSQRVSNLIAIRENKPSPKYSRNPFAYFFALFSFGGPGSAGNNMFITVAIIALLAAIAIPNILRARLLANDAAAKANLTSILDTVQDYVKTYGAYPNSMDDFDKTLPAYALLESYCQKTIAGYQYKCNFSNDDFEFKATPVEIGVSGSNTWLVNKNGLFSQANNSTAE